MEALFPACAGRATSRPQNPVQVDAWSEPQPDLAVLRSRAGFYATGERPGPADVLLLIEVSGSSLWSGRMVKLPPCARAGIPEAGIADLTRCLVEGHRIL